MAAHRQNRQASIGTNSQSIVSKRSVEEIYFPNDPPFFSVFCNGKRKRRAPLINRGYWLRMKAIESVTEGFLRDTTNSKRIKVVVNLGCGYDALPWRLKHKMTAFKEDDGSFHNVLFIDIDFPELLEKKAEYLEDPIFGEEELELIDCGSCPHNAYNGWYAQIGADLSNLEQMSEGLDHILCKHSTSTGMYSYDFLFVAEVSTTYMPTESANSLFKWLATGLKKDFSEPFALFDIGEIKLCVLEQIIPGGPDHPFAKTMLQHFRESAPLMSVEKYPMAQDQIKRFIQAGWSCANALTLWDIWDDFPNIVSQQDKKQVGHAEQFDEWEEFILFASHYVLIQASNLENIQTSLDIRNGFSNHGKEDFSMEMDPFFSFSSKLCRPGRLFGQAMVFSDDIIRVIGGSQQSKSLEIYDTRGRLIEPSPILPIGNVVCHTVTKVGPKAHLLVGGRTSPSRPSAKCLLYQENLNEWILIQDISPSRYRHCAAPVKLDSEDGVLVFGGRSSELTVLSDWQFWGIKSRKWMPVTPSVQFALFGAAMMANDNTTGIILGGLDENESLSGLIWTWKLTRHENGNLHVNLEQLMVRHRPDVIKRFGTMAVNSPWGPLFVGGVGPTPNIHNEDIYLLQPDGQLTFVSIDQSPYERYMQRPLLVGISLAKVNGAVVLSGGGAICFSFGSYFNEAKLEIYKFSSVQSPSTNTIRSFLVEKSLDDARLLLTQDFPGGFSLSHHLPPYLAVKALPISSVPACEMVDLLETTMKRKIPYVMRNLNHFSPDSAETTSHQNTCLDTWSIDHISRSFEPDTRISLHKADTRYLQFSPLKNFRYQTILGSELAKEMRDYPHCYLRALATNKPFKQPANFWRDFPSLANDFSVPTALSEQFDLLECGTQKSKSNLHSSVLRVSGDVALWLHYDVMSNFWFQISGNKRVLLFPPEDIASGRLKFEVGQTVSSTMTQCFECLVYTAEEMSTYFPLQAPQQDPIYRAVEETSGYCQRAFVVNLQAGEILYIPRFWGHATFPEMSDPISIAVNVFFREPDLESRHMNWRKDIYGSQDLAIYEQGLNVIKSIAKGIHLSSPGTQIAAETARQMASYLRGGSCGDHYGNKDIIHLKSKFNGLPDDVRHFYSVRLGRELQHMTYRWSQYRDEYD